MRRLIPATLLLLALAACASDGPNRTASELADLRRDCAARNGILVPNGNASGDPITDHDCNLTGASLLNK